MRAYRHYLFAFVLMLLTGASAAQLRQVAVLDIPGRPGFESVAWAKGFLLMAHDASNTVDVFDPAKRRVIAQVKGMNDPRGLAVDDQTGLVYVANAGDKTIAVISAKDWAVQDRIQLQDAPDTLLFVPELSTLYIGNWRTQAVSTLKAGQHQPSAAIPVGGRPERMVYDAATGQVFIAIEDKAEVIALDKSGQIPHRYKLSASLPTGLALDPRSRRLFVAVRYAVVVMNADTGEEISRVPAPQGTDTLWFDPSNGTLYAGATGGSVNMIRLANNRYQTEHELQTSIRGHTLAFDPVKKMVYMPGGHEGRAKLVILKRVEAPVQNAAAPAKPAAAPVLPRSFPTSQAAPGEETARAK